MSKFLFDGKEFETREEAEEYIHDDYARDLYDDYLNEQGDVEICGFKYSPADVLKKISPTTYRCGYNDFCDLFDIEEIEEYEEEEETA